MKIFPKDKKLEARFLAGKAPEPETMLGTEGAPAKMRVRMLTGPIPNMGRWPFYHRKEFASEGKEICGGNVFTLGGLFVTVFFLALWFFGFDGRWGAFRLEKREGYLLINYAVPENGWLTKRIRDHIRTTDDPDVFIGKFHWVWRGREIFLGYFTLTRIKAE